MISLLTGGLRALAEPRSAGLIRAVGAGLNDAGMMLRSVDVLGRTEGAAVGTLRCDYTWHSPVVAWCEPRKLLRQAFNDV
jgi:hypothetical protein